MARAHAGDGLRSPGGGLEAGNALHDNGPRHIREEGGVHILLAHRLNLETLPVVAAYWREDVRNCTSRVLLRPVQHSIVAAPNTADV